MRSKAFSRSSRGFTLVELMVGVLIGLIGTVVIFQVFAVSESQKRTTTGSSDAQQNGVFGLFQIERDIRMAGYGLNHMALLGCQINGWFEPGGAKINFKLVPVEIINGVGGAPDEIRLAFGNSDLFMAPAKFDADANNSQANYKIDNKFGFNEGDLVVAAESGKPCTLGQVSTLPQSDREIVHNSGRYTNNEGAQVPTKYNKPGGLPAPEGQAYKQWDPVGGTGGRLYNLGAEPTVVTYSIKKNQLVATNSLTPGVAGATAELADGVVQLQAQYGFDGDGDGFVSPTAAAVVDVNLALAGDQWADNMPVAAVGLDWARVIAVRLVVTARSITPERPNPALGTCDATTVQPRWISPAPQANPPGIELDVKSAFADPNEWMCYRYRTFEVVVPIRNMLWFPLNA
jgi:type IV pilus assembly protein PilW